MPGVRGAGAAAAERLPGADVAVWEAGLARGQTFTAARLAAELLDRGGTRRPIGLKGAAVPLADLAWSLSRFLDPHLRGLPTPVVAISLPNGPLHLAVVIGSWLSGAVVLAIGTSAGEAEIERCLDTIAPAAVVSGAEDPRFSKQVGSVLATEAGAIAISRPASVADAHDPPLGPKDALILSTSGSTADPKFVVLTASAIRHNIEQAGSYFDLGRHDRLLIFTPAHFALTFNQYLAAVFHDATPLCWPHGLRSPLSLAEFARSHASTGIWANPTAYELLIEALAHPLTSIRFAMLGGQPLGTRLFTRLRRAFPAARIVSAYGITENVARVAFFDCGDGHRWQHLPTAPVGCPIPGVHLELREHDAERGEIVISGASLMRGYLGEIAGPEDAVASHATGDLGRLDPDLGLILTGRLKLMINVGNEKVSPEAIEAVIHSVAGVGDCAAGADADPLLGEVAVLLYASDRVDDAALQRDMLAACRKRLTPAHAPRRFVKVASADIPRTKTGKVDRAGVKALIDML